MPAKASPESGDFPATCVTGWSPETAGRLLVAETSEEPEFAGAGNSVGVRETSRLISRLRHRQFGVLVTTSYLDAQAYREIREDGHPVVVLAGRDVIERLKARGLDNIAALGQHLHDAYPPHG